MNDTHDAYWTKVADCALARIHDVFHGASRSADGLAGDGNGVDDRHDVEECLAYVFRHGDSRDRARMAVAAFELIQAWHELREHGGAKEA